MAQAAQNMDVLSSTDNIKILANVLKTNVSACTSIGSFYLPQLGRIFLDMLGLYKAVSGIVSETIQKEGMFVYMFLYWRFPAHFGISRCRRYEDPKSSTTENREEGNLKTYGNVY